MKKSKKGFSLIELIVIMSIMAILVLIAAPRYLNYTKEAREKQIVADVKTANSKLSEYMVRNNDSLPIGSSNINSSILTAYVADEKIYDLTGKVTSLDVTKPYELIPANYFRQNISTRLKGSFIVSSGGNVYYIDADYIDLATINNKPEISYTDNSNPDYMTATITYPIDSSIQEYKIDDGAWEKAEIVTSKNKAPFLMTISAAEDKLVYELAIPYGSIVSARATYSDGQSYEANLALDTPEINLSTISKTDSLTAEIKDISGVVRKEYRLSTGNWTVYNNDVLIDDNTVLYTRGIDANGNIIAYNKIPITNIVDVMWYGLPDAAFDNDTSTYVFSVVGKTITWTGNLANRVVFIDIKRESSDATPWVNFTDASGNALPAYTTAGTKYTDFAPGNGVRRQYYFVVPETAASITISGANTGTTVYEIHEATDLILPSTVTNISSTSQNYAITLNWTNPTDADFKTVWIYRDGNLVGSSNTGTYVDPTLTAGTTYSYQLRAVDTTGNVSSAVMYTATTTKPAVVFSGLAAGAFDKNAATSVAIEDSVRNVTWTGDLAGKVLYIDLKRFSSDATPWVYFIDATGKAIPATTTTGKQYTDFMPGNGVRSQYEFVVPATATGIQFSCSRCYVVVYDIYGKE